MSELLILTPTYNRPESLVRTARSLITEPNTFMAAIDQNQERPTEQHLKSSAQDVLNHPQFDYLFSQIRGEANARNFGIEHFKERLKEDSLFVCIDDDITVPKGWSTQVRDLAAKYPEVGIFSGAVEQGFEPDEGGIIHVFSPKEATQIIELDKFHLGGMTAHMIIRPWVFDQIGTFDPKLGSGSHFGAADDIDILYRALKENIPVMAVQNPSVFHYGVRRNDEITELYNRYTYGLGAIMGKYLQNGEWNTALLASEFSSHLCRAVRSLVTTGRPTGIGSSLNLAKGIFDGLRTPAETSTRIFRS